MTTHSRAIDPLDVEFNVDTEMKDVEILRVFQSHILAKGQRFGRRWLLRGLPPDRRNDPALLRQLFEEFDRRFSCRTPDAPLTVGIEDIRGLGPCIVEEWREESPASGSIVKGGERKTRKLTLFTKRALILTSAIAALVALWQTTIYVSSLSSRSDDTKAALETLRRTHRQDEARMFMLADSLDKALHAPLIPDEYAGRVDVSEEDPAERMAGVLYQKKIKEFEKTLARYDRDVIPQAAGDLPAFYDSISALYRRMIDMGVDVEQYGTSPQLPEDDRIRLRNKLYEGYMIRTSDYLKVWIPMARAAHERRKEERSLGEEKRN